MDGNGTPSLAERLIAAQQPRGWAELSSAERSASMDAALRKLVELTAAHNRLVELVETNRDAATRLRSRVESLERSWWQRVRESLSWLVAGGW